MKNKYNFKDFLNKIEQKIHKNIIENIKIHSKRKLWISNQNKNPKICMFK